MGRASLQTPRDLLAQIDAELTEERAFRFPELDLMPTDPILDRVGVPADQRQIVVSLFKDHRTEWVRSLLEQVVVGLPDELKAFLLDEQSVLAAEVNTGDVNAHAIQAPNGGWLILLNRGIISFAYKAARAFAIHFRFDGDPEKSAPERERTADLIATVFDWYLVTGIPLGPDFDIEPRQMAVASRIATEAEKFIVAHEVGHHLLGHVAAGTRSMLVAGQAVKAMDVSYQQELDADHMGLRLSLESITSTEPFDYNLAYAGIEMFLQVVSLLEAYAAAPESDTHPSAAERLAALRKTLATEVDPKHKDAIDDLAIAMDDLLKEIREHVLSADRRQQALKRQPEFDALLLNLVEQHAHRTDMRHVPFREAIEKLQFQFSPEVICRGLATELRRGFEDFAKEKGDEERSEAHDRMTLMVGFIETNAVFREAVMERAAPDGAEPP